MPATKVEAFYDFKTIFPFVLFLKIKNKSEAHFSIVHLTILEMKPFSLFESLCELKGRVHN